MNWLVDAQLPRRLADRINALGHDARHTLDLPTGNRTADAESLLPDLEAAFRQSNCVELTRTGLVIHQ